MTVQAIGGGVTLKSIIAHTEEITMYLSDTVASDEAASALVGQPVCLDTGAANTVRLVGATDEDGMQIQGVLMAVERRVTEGVVVCTVLMKGGAVTIPYKTSDAVAIGDKVVASDTAGKVRKAVFPGSYAAATVLPLLGIRNQVVGKDAGAETVDVIFW